jgi:hypothetical protein
MSPLAVFEKNHVILQISRFTSENKNLQKRSFMGVCSNI